MWQNRNLQRRTCLLMFRQVLHPRKSPSKSKSTGILTASGKPESRMRRNSKFDATSSSQVRLQDAYLSGLMDTATGKPVATKEESGDVDLSESETWSFQEETVLGRLVKGYGDPQCIQKIRPTSKSESGKKRMVTQSTRDSSHNIPHTEAVFSIVRRIYGRERDDPMDYLDVNMAIWSIFLNATLRAAVHLGQDYEANLRYVKNNLWNSVGQLFNENEKN